LVLINYMTGQVLRIEPITEADDLAAASSRSAAMASAGTTLKEAVGKAATQSTNPGGKRDAQSERWASPCFDRLPRG
jgi:hypothetical protein